MIELSSHLCLNVQQYFSTLNTSVTNILNNSSGGLSTWARRNGCGGWRQGQETEAGSCGILVTSDAICGPWGNSSETKIGVSISTGEALIGVGTALLFRDLKERNGLGHTSWDHRHFQTIDYSPREQNVWSHTFRIPYIVAHLFVNVWRPWSFFFSLEPSGSGRDVEERRQEQETPGAWPLEAKLLLGGACTDSGK